MQHISTTPFGRRPVTSGLMAARALAEAPIPDAGAVPDKWTILKDLTAARAAFGVTDRDLAVLSALVSFHPGVSLAEGDGTIVFPSNAALSDRAHGMAESTLRRHVAALVAAGLVLRHDSPNGKRYAARDRRGGVAVVFGFDLRPLLVRAEEIAGAARAAREAELRMKRLREAVVLRLRDAAKFIAYGRETMPNDWDAFDDRLRLLQRDLRRKMAAEALMAMNEAVAALLSRLQQALSLHETKNMSGNDSDNERHKQYSNTASIDSEPSQKREEAQPPCPGPEPSLPLYLVLKACPDLRDYAPAGIGHWHELVGTADFVRPMLGISPDAWAGARAAMGDAVAAIALACILQRASDIRNPGGYLRALTDKAGSGAFSPGPMVMALLRAENSKVL